METEVHLKVKAINLKESYAHLDFLPDENFRITVYGDYRFKPKKTLF